MRPSTGIRVFRTSLAYPNCSPAWSTRFPISRYGKDNTCRFYYNPAGTPSATAIVVGAGPAGLTVVGNLLDSMPELRVGRRQLVWIDPYFQGGRVGALYREVPSNTKVSLFIQYANSLKSFQSVAKTVAAPNALTALRALPQDQGCHLSYAANLSLMLTEGLAGLPAVRLRRQTVASATLNERTRSWLVRFENGLMMTTWKLALCTGSRPISNAVPAIQEMRQGGLKSVDLDVALSPSKIATAFNPAADTTVAVVGASHSAVLVLMNLVNLAGYSHPKLKIKWFTRNPLRYAEYMDGWILRDNTGLKGEAAEWARQNLDDKTFAESPVSNIITKVWTAGKEEEMYKAELPGCTHIVQAVGYARNPIPRLEIVKKGGGPAAPLDVEFDHNSGRFYRAGEPKTGDERGYVPGLFGAGIAFPERVRDPHGNIEYAVGFSKFMNFAKRAVPDWVRTP